LIKRVAKLGWILIVVGVMGEGAFEVLVSRADNGLHQFDEAVLNEARREAGDAATSAKIAREEADAASAEAETAKTAGGIAVSKSDRANAVAGKALGTSKTATNAASEVREKVEAVAEQADDIDRKLWQTEYLVSSRSLRNKELLITTLRRFNRKKVVLKSFIGDAEGWDLCNSLFNAAATAEMDPVNNCGKEYFSPPLLTGILIFGSTKQEIEEFMHIIADAVDPGGAGGMSPEPGSTLTIRVGIKVPYLRDKAHVFPPPAKKQTIKPNTKH
jgi:hypothetical protein